MFRGTARGLSACMHVPRAWRERVRCVNRGRVGGGGGSLRLRGLRPKNGPKPIHSSGLQKCGILEGHALRILLHQHSQGRGLQTSCAIATNGWLRTSKGVVPCTTLPTPPECCQGYVSSPSVEMDISHEIPPSACVLGGNPQLR